MRQLGTEAEPSLAQMRSARRTLRGLARAPLLLTGALQHSDVVDVRRAELRLLDSAVALSHHNSRLVQAPTE